MLSLKSSLNSRRRRCRFSPLAIGAAPSGALAQQQFHFDRHRRVVTGVYYPAGGAICRLMNQTRSEHGIRLLGGIHWWLGLQHQRHSWRGSRIPGVAQSDVQYNAFNGGGAI